MPRLSASQLIAFTPRGDPLSPLGHTMPATRGDASHRVVHHRSPSAASRAKPDILTGVEKARIERAFYKAGPLTSAAAAEAVFASFGWELTAQERLRWFPDDDDPLSGEPQRQPNPVALQDVLRVMRSKKEEFLAFAADGENETLSMFVSLGGAVDGSGHADIASLIEAVQRLRGEAPRKRSTLTTVRSGSALIRKTTLAALTSREAPSVEISRAFGDDDDEEDDGELSTEQTTQMMSGSTSADQMLATQLKTMPRMVGYAAFTEALQLLRTAASGGGSVGQGGAARAFCAPGTPTDADMVPSAQSPSGGGHQQQRQSVANVATVMTMVDNVGHWGGHRPPRGSLLGGPLGASGVFRQSAGSSGGVAGASSHTGAAKHIEDDEWSAGDADDDDGTTHHAEDSSTSDACHRLRQAISNCVQSFHSRQPPPATLARIAALPPSGMTPMSMDGTSLSELVAERKRRAQKTKPITPVMMLREKAKEELLVMETQRLVDAQLQALLHQKEAAKKKPQQAPPLEGQGGGGRVASVSGGRRRQASKIDSAPNDFVESLAKHVAYLERTNRPASACSVRPAARQARVGAPRLVESWKRRSVGKLVEARERALELAIAELPQPDADASCGSAGQAAVTSVAASLQPPVMGFERPARAATPDGIKSASSKVSPFLTYPHPGVYRNPSSRVGGDTKRSKHE